MSATIAHEGYFEGSDGHTRFDIIMNNIADVQGTVRSDEPVSVSKHLCGSHRESYVVLNTVAGKTFSQAKFQKQMAEKFPDIPPKDLPQAFVVDVPRIVELAKAMAKGRDNEEDAFKVALFAGLAFQFATAALLTDGTLRQFVVE